LVLRFVVINFKEFWILILLYKNIICLKKYVVAGELVDLVGVEAGEVLKHVLRAARRKFDEIVRQIIKYKYQLHIT
jgi:hypothetical protein